jgi:ribosomal protein S10
LSLGRTGQAATIPITGENVRWIVDDEVYEERIKTRLISYSAVHKVRLERFDQVDITAEIKVALITD